MPKILTEMPATKEALKKPVADIQVPTKKKKVVIAPEKVADLPPRDILYEEVGVELCFGDAAITETIAKSLLGWETEKERLLRAQQENPGITKEQLALFEFDDDYILKDHEGNKIRCWNNLNNRPLDESWCHSLTQVILRGQWAGPRTIEGETVNGSTIIISRTGRVESGQHSLIAIVLAFQLWWKDRKAYPFWTDTSGPVIETIIITGISEDRRITMTVDNCKPRSEADVFYTSDLFVKLVPKDRKECSRMMAGEVDLFWPRSGAQGYKTHPEVIGLVDRHPKLLKCIEHLFVENHAKKGRKISDLGLQPGQMAAVLYLLGCSASDGVAYRNGMPPNEKMLDWKYWDKAKQFFALLGGSPDFAEVRYALKPETRPNLTPEQLEDFKTMGERLTLAEKLAIIAKAWDPFREGMPILKRDVELIYNTNDETGKSTLISVANFGGIDKPAKVAEPDPEVGEEEVGEGKEEVLAKRREDTLAKLKELRGGAKPAAPKTIAGPAVKVENGKKVVTKPVKPA